MVTATTLETVTSGDGTTIAYERTGSGTPLVLVHGVAGDHTRWELGDVRSALAEHHTVYAMDRRGRGGSGDTADYELAREFDDVAAVVDSIDEPANLLGHSHGALCALGAALETGNLARLVLYEPSTPWEILGSYISNEGALTDMEALLEEGENEQALVVFMREFLGLSPEELDALRSAPSWRGRVEAAGTLPRELRAPAEYEFDPARFADVTTPTLLLTGGESPEWAREATKALHDALPNSRVEVLEGQGHLAMNTAPGLFVDAVLSFLREPA